MTAVSAKRENPVELPSAGGIKPRKHIFDNRALLAIMMPLVAEQLLNLLMGTADSMMVSNVGPEALSAVSLVDSINILVIQAFTALAAGGTVVCAQYVGAGRKDKAMEAARQLVLVVAVISSILMALCMALRHQILALIFGRIDTDVMAAARIYFFWTLMSYPFLSLYNAGAAVYRAQGNTSTPLRISIASNALNIVGNAILIWGCGLGVAGAAIATTASRLFSMIVVLSLLRNPGQEIYVRGYAGIRPDMRLIRKILRIGIPNGIENSMFQFGKLVIQSSVSTLGTVAIAAQAMTNILEVLNGIAGIGIGMGLMTVVGQCLGAGEEEEAAYYIKKMTIWAYAAVFLGSLLVYLATGPITRLGGMTPESAALCLWMMGWISVVKPVLWAPAFVIPYGLRAAGDVRFTMLASMAIMWLARVSLCIWMIRGLGMGPMAVWIAMFIDWACRTVVYVIRYRSRRWLRFHVV